MSLLHNVANKLSSYTKFIKRGIPNNKINFLEFGKFQAVSSTDLFLPYCITTISNKIDYIDEAFEKTKTEEFNQKLILLPRTILKIRAIFSDNNIHILDRIYYFSLMDNLQIDIKTILLILNSKITTFYYDYLYGSTKIGGGYIDLKGTQISNFPIFKHIENQEPFIQKADLMLELNKKLQETKQIFYNELKLKKLTTKLQKFEELEFDDFIKEYTKSKKIKFADKLEERNFKNDWKALFENDKKEVLEIQNQINITDKEIDQMVYKLYDLTQDEIKIVEGI